MNMETTKVRDTNELADSRTAYLRPQIKVEPLMYGWHAWPHLLAPLQHGLNIVNRQVGIMKSFVSNPSIHVAASRNPALAGGPFIDLPPGERGAVQDLLTSTLREFAPLVELANAYLEFDRSLQSSANGYTLESFYESMPTPLRGLVELFYDINSHPKIRFFEQLLWDLKLNEHAQQIYVGPMPDDARKFFMSNPRVDAGEGMILPVSFSDPRLDILAAARCVGAPYGKLRSLIESPSASVQASDFITFDPSPEIAGLRAADPDGLRVRYFGHACVLIETPETSVLIDPVLAWERNLHDGRFTYHDLPSRIDYIAISHGHHDHFYAESLLQLRWKTGTVIVPTSNTGNVTDPSLKLIARQLGFQNVQALDPMEAIDIPGGRIISLPFPGEHADLDIYTKQSLLVELAGQRLLFLVDSNAWDLALYTRLAATLGPIDMLFVGMECHGAPLSWLYGPLLSQTMTRKNDESRRLSASKADRAWEVVAELNPSKVYLYAMGQEPFLSHLTGLAYEDDSVQLREARKFAALCRDNGVEFHHLDGSRVLLE
jgi:L-ascorbate metabolism protein UlaG (beta-lactamase superfamily)